MNKGFVAVGAGLWFLAGDALGADCPPVTLADMMEVPAGKHPPEYELAEFEELAGCTLTFQENPAIADLNAQIVGNPPLPPLAERLPEESLVTVPYAQAGRYGGILDVLSNATEAGTSDFLSVRHVNLVRYADDLSTDALATWRLGQGWLASDRGCDLTPT